MDEEKAFQVQMYANFIIANVSNIDFYFFVLLDGRSYLFECVKKLLFFYLYINIFYINIFFSMFL